jgi:hypothetical protein
MLKKSGYDDGISGFGKTLIPYDSGICLISLIGGG